MTIATPSQTVKLRLPDQQHRRHVERCLTKSKARTIQPDTFRYVDPVRNPYAPGAGQRPPELAGRDAELMRVRRRLGARGAGRPERSLVLTGLRGVGKTVLLNALRSKALDDAGGAPERWRPGLIRVSADRSPGRCMQLYESCRCGTVRQTGCVRFWPR